jgi:hypothetical protein
MTPDQVKQVTDNLITEREHLSTEMQTSGTPQQPVPVPAAITGTVAARGQAQPAAGAQSPAQPASGEQAGGSAVTAGAYARP